MDELLEQFLVESRDLLADANAAVRLLQRNAADAGAIDAAFRSVHTLKGSVAIFDMAPAERVLHAIEDLLSHARSGGTAIGSDDISGLIGAFDQIDRWIDQLEANGELATNAASIAQALIGGVIPHSAAAASAETSDALPWLDQLLERHGQLVAEHDDGLIAFRYMPDGDAFFRGEDPVNVVSQVPGLVTFDILPAGGEWPATDTFEPFACVMVIEGLSTAPQGEIAQAFRLVPGQATLSPAKAVEVDGTVAESLDLTASGATRIVRVEATRLDRLANDVGELGVAANAIGALTERAEAIDQQLALAIRAVHSDLERAVGAVARSVSSVRMISLEPNLRRLPRLVRDIAAELGKNVQLEMTGERTEVDKQIADGLFEPLLHLMRNAIDHGIESEGVRRAAGKAVQGAMRLAIAREADEIRVTLSDDGAGIDRTRVRDVAVARGLVTRDAADALSDTGVLALLFTPGFSTATAVTGVSGRGVGMDAVQAAIDRMRGRIEIDSELDVGTAITLRLPANAITTRLLVIEVANDRYAVPLDQISETVRVSSDRLIPIGGGTVCVLRETTIPVLSLAELLGRTEKGVLPAKLLVTRANGDPVALRIDGFHERLDAMVRPPTGLLAQIPMVGGTTVMSDGAVMLVLEMAELIG